MSHHIALQMERAAGTLLPQHLLDHLDGFLVRIAPRHRLFPYVLFGQEEHRRIRSGVIVSMVGRSWLFTDDRVPQGAALRQALQRPGHTLD